MAERLAYGTPLEPVARDTAMHLVPRSGTALIGRILISAIFIISGFAKLVDPAGVIAYMNSAGVPAADTLVYVAALGELLGGLAILFGFLSRLAGLLLIIQLAITTYYFHAFWALFHPDNLPGKFSHFFCVEPGKDRVVFPLARGEAIQEGEIFRVREGLKTLS